MNMTRDPRRHAIARGLSALCACALLALAACGSGSSAPGSQDTPSDTTGAGQSGTSGSTGSAQNGGTGSVGATAPSTPTPTPVGPAPEILLTALPPWVFGGGNVTLYATPSASNGLASVTFLRTSPDPMELGSLTAPPWEWPAVAYGGGRTISTVFRARACDQAGLCTESDYATVVSTWLCKFPPC